MPLLPQPTPASAPTEASGRVFEACAAVPAPPQDVLRALTDPEVLAHWSPLPFEVQDLEGGRLRPGASASVCGQLAGVRALFRVHVTKADDEGLELTAHGPVDLDVSYCFHAAPPGQHGAGQGGGPPPPGAGRSSARARHRVPARRRRP